MSDRAPITHFRRWLKEVPQPVALRCDDNKVVRISKGQRSCWSEAEKSVVALDATLVEALDNQGNVLRAFRLREEEAPEPAKPRGVESWPDAPEAQMAQIIVASNDRTGARLEAVFKMAFDRMAQMHDAIVQRHDEALSRAAQAEARLERERRQWLEQQIKAAGAPSEDDDQGFNGLISTLIEARLKSAMNSGERHTNGNGKDS